MTIAVHEWGEPDSPPLVCLHGVTSHGRHFRPLAERLIDRYRVLALDQRGHGDSTWEPPWHLEQYVEDALAATPDKRCTWLGHSFGGRVAYEVAAAVPERVERLVLLDPAIRIPPYVGLRAAEKARADRSYVSFAEGIERRYEESVLTTAPRELVEAELGEHLLPDEDGRFRYRYCQSAVVSMYGELCTPPPPPETMRTPTLLLYADEFGLVREEQVESYRAALGDRLEVVTVPGGHMVYWDAYDATAEALDRFLA